MSEQCKTEDDCDYPAWCRGKDTCRKAGSRAASCSFPTLYQQRDIEKLSPYYMRHLNAMTREGLHSKSDIAAELAVRDSIIDELLGKNDKVKPTIKNTK